MTNDFRHLTFGEIYNKYFKLTTIGNFMEIKMLYLTVMDAYRQWFQILELGEFPNQDMSLIDMNNMFLDRAAQKGYDKEKVRLLCEQDINGNIHQKH